MSMTPGNVVTSHVTTKLNPNEHAAITLYVETVGENHFLRSSLLRMVNRGEMWKVRNQIVVMARKAWHAEKCNAALALWDEPQYDTSFLDEAKLPVYTWGVVV